MATGAPPGCYLLLVLAQPCAEEHKEHILRKVEEGLLSWDVKSTRCDLQGIDTVCSQIQTSKEPESELLIQHSTENLAVEVLLNPHVSTLKQCLKNLLAANVGHKHVIHAGYAFTGSGSWILQDGNFSYQNLMDTLQDVDVQKALRLHPGCTIHIHCIPEGPWAQPEERTSSDIPESLYINPAKNVSVVPGSTHLIQCLDSVLRFQPLTEMMKSSPVVGNIRFNRPTLYVFPGGQGDCALFGVSGFTMLIDGGFNRKPCFWEFIRHLDRLDAIMITRLNENNVCGITNVIRRKREGKRVYPQVGYVFCNVAEGKSPTSPGSSGQERDPLLVSVIREGREFSENLHQLGLKPHRCLRDNLAEPLTLFHKVGHGTLEMHVLSPPKDSKEMKLFFQQWTSYKEHFTSKKYTDDGEMPIPLSHAMSICALLIWKPSDPSDTITRVLLPGSAPQSKIFEGLEHLGHLEELKYKTCSQMSLGIKYEERVKIKTTKKHVVKSSIKQKTDFVRPASPTKLMRDSDEIKIIRRRAESPVKSLIGSPVRKVKKVIKKVDEKRFVGVKEEIVSKKVASKEVKVTKKIKKSNRAKVQKLSETADKEVPEISGIEIMEKAEEALQQTEEDVDSLLPAEEESIRVEKGYDTQAEEKILLETADRDKSLSETEKEDIGLSDSHPERDEVEEKVGSAEISKDREIVEDTKETEQEKEIQEEKIEEEKEKVIPEEKIEEEKEKVIPEEKIEEGKEKVIPEEKIEEEKETEDKIEKETKGKDEDEKEIEDKREGITLILEKPSENEVETKSVSDTTEDDKKSTGGELDQILTSSPPLEDKEIVLEETIKKVSPLDEKKLEPKTTSEKTPKKVKKSSKISALKSTTSASTNKLRKETEIRKTAPKKDKPLDKEVKKVGVKSVKAIPKTMRKEVVSDSPIKKSEVLRATAKPKEIKTVPSMKEIKAPLTLKITKKAEPKLLKSSSAAEIKSKVSKESTIKRMTESKLSAKSAQSVKEKDSTALPKSPVKKPKEKIPVMSPKKKVKPLSSLTSRPSKPSKDKTKPKPVKRPGKIKDITPSAEEESSPEIKGPIAPEELIPSQVSSPTKESIDEEMVQEAPSSPKVLETPKETATEIPSSAIDVNEVSLVGSEDKGSELGDEGIVTTPHELKETEVFDEQMVVKEIEAVEAAVDELIEGMRTEIGEPKLQSKVDQEDERIESPIEELAVLIEDKAGASADVGDLEGEISAEELSAGSKEEKSPSTEVSKTDISWESLQKSLTPLIQVEVTYIKENIKNMGIQLDNYETVIFRYISMYFRKQCMAPTFDSVKSYITSNKKNIVKVICEQYKETAEESALTSESREKLKEEISAKVDEKIEREISIEAKKMEDISAAAGKVEKDEIPVVAKKIEEVEISIEVKKEKLSTDDQKVEEEIFLETEKVEKEIPVAIEKIEETHTKADKVEEDEISIEIEKEDISTEADKNEKEEVSTEADKGERDEIPIKTKEVEKEVPTEVEKVQEEIIPIEDDKEIFAESKKIEEEISKETEKIKQEEIPEAADRVEEENLPKEIEKEKVSTEDKKVEKEEISTKAEKDLKRESLTEEEKEISMVSEQKKEISATFEEEKEITATPEQEEGVTVLSEVEKEIAASPEQEKEVTTVSEEEKEVTVVSEEEKEIAATSKKSEDIAMTPKEEKEVSVVSDQAKETSATIEQEREVTVVSEQKKEVAMTPEPEKEIEATPKEKEEFMTEEEFEKLLTPEVEEGISSIAAEIESIQLDDPHEVIIKYIYLLLQVKEIIPEADSLKNYIIKFRKEIITKIFNDYEKQQDEEKVPELAKDIFTQSMFEDLITSEIKKEVFTISAELKNITLDEPEQVILKTIYIILKDKEIMPEPDSLINYIIKYKAEIIAVIQNEYADILEEDQKEKEVSPEKELEITKDVSLAQESKPDEKRSEQQIHGQLTRESMKIIDELVEEHKSGNMSKEDCKNILLASLSKELKSKNLPLQEDTIKMYINKYRTEFIKILRKEFMSAIDVIEKEEIPIQVTLEKHDLREVSTESIAEILTGEAQKLLDELIDELIPENVSKTECKQIILVALECELRNENLPLSKETIITYLIERRVTFISILKEKYLPMLEGEQKDVDASEEPTSKEIEITIGSIENQLTSGSLKLIDELIDECKIEDMSNESCKSLLLEILNQELLERNLPLNSKVIIMYITEYRKEFVTLLKTRYLEFTTEEGEETEVPESLKEFIDESIEDLRSPKEEVEILESLDVEEIRKLINPQTQKIIDSLEEKIKLEDTTNEEFCELLLQAIQKIHVENKIECNEESLRNSLSINEAEIIKIISQLHNESKHLESEEHFQESEDAQIISHSELKSYSTPEIVKVITSLKNEIQISIPEEEFQSMLYDTIIERMQKEAITLNSMNILNYIIRFKIEIINLILNRYNIKESTEISESASAAEEERIDNEVTPSSIEVIDSKAVNGKIPPYEGEATDKKFKGKTPSPEKEMLTESLIEQLEQKLPSPIEVEGITSIQIGEETKEDVTSIETKELEIEIPTETSERTPTTAKESFPAEEAEDVTDGVPTPKETDSGEKDKESVEETLLLDKESTTKEEVKKELTQKPQTPTEKIASEKEAKEIVEIGLSETPQDIKAEKQLIEKTPSPKEEEIIPEVEIEKVQVQTLSLSKEFVSIEEMKELDESQPSTALLDITTSEKPIEKLSYPEKEEELTDSKDKVLTPKEPSILEEELKDEDIKKILPSPILHKDDELLKKTPSPDGDEVPSTDRGTIEESAEKVPSPIQLDTTDPKKKPETKIVMDETPSLTLEETTSIEKEITETTISLEKDKTPEEKSIEELAEKDILKENVLLEDAGASEPQETATEKTPSDSDKEPVVEKLVEELKGKAPLPISSPDVCDEKDSDFETEMGVISTTLHVHDVPAEKVSEEIYSRDTDLDLTLTKSVSAGGLRGEPTTEQTEKGESDKIKDTEPLSDMKSEIKTEKMSFAKTPTPDKEKQLQENITEPDILEAAKTPSPTKRGSPISEQIKEDQVQEIPSHTELKSDLSEQKTAIKLSSPEEAVERLSEEVEINLEMTAEAEAEAATISSKESTVIRKSSISQTVLELEPKDTTLLKSSGKIEKEKNIEKAGC